jgi:hypothetical protein
MNMSPSTIIHSGSATTAGADRRRARRRLVIADWGSTAELIVLPVEGPVGRGAEFNHRGTRWVITGRRRDSRVLVAQPRTH